jgi:hypothetical protein
LQPQNKTQKFCLAILRNLLEVRARKFHTHFSQDETKPQKKLKTLINIRPLAISEAGQNECEQYQPAYGLIFLYSRQMRTSKNQNSITT